MNRFEVLFVVELLREEKKRTWAVLDSVEWRTDQATSSE